MKTKLVLQLSVLLAALVAVLIARNVTESGGLKKTLNTLFGVVEQKKINWCAAHVVDVDWLLEVPGTLKELSPADKRESYCELPAEDISGIDPDAVTWQPLARSSGATGQTSILEWNAENGLFRAGGLPFKSSEFNRQLRP